MDFGENLKRLRVLAGLTQKDLADLLNTTPVTVSRWETGEKKPSFDAILSLVSVLNVSSDSLLCVVENHGPLISDEELSILNKIRNLDPTSRELVLHVIDIESTRNGTRQ